jgi:large subunit ribosomal protein L29
MMKDIREKSNVELLKEVDTLKEELFTLRFKKATGQLTNFGRIKEIRKTIARIKTVISERAVSEAK